MKKPKTPMLTKQGKAGTIEGKQFFEADFPLFVMEKKDGIRAQLFDGVFYTRTGKVINAPKEILNLLPDSQNMVIDGELHGPNCSFNEVSGILRRNDQTMEDWFNAGIQFSAFDYYHVDTDEDHPFELEYQVRLMMLGADTSMYCGTRWYSVMRHHTVFNDGQLDYISDLYNDGNSGCEGIIVRDPKAFYHHGRADGIWKRKFLVIEDAYVIGYNSGTGRNKLTVGSLQCRLEDGTEFNVSLHKDSDKKDPPLVGQKIVFQSMPYEGLGVLPRMAVYHGLRAD